MTTFGSGEGARLKSLDGRTFMDKFGGLKDLAPRDEVSRAIYEEMILTNADHVLLDLASYAKVNVKTRFPHIFETCQRYGIDIGREPIPVVPAAHYCCGGVLVDTWGKTSLHGLYAVGEASCTGLHGANRLASTSLLEGLVWGTRAGRFLAGDRTPPAGFSESDVREWYYPSQPEEVDPALINQDWLTIRSTMWNYAGLVRTTKRLERAKADLEYLEHRIDKFYREAILDPDIILMDEPFSALDIQTRQLMENEVLELWAASRKAVLFITHDLDEAIAMMVQEEMSRSQREFLDLHDRIWGVLREEVLKGYAQQKRVA